MTDMHDQAAGYDSDAVLALVRAWALLDAGHSRRWALA